MYNSVFSKYFPRPLRCLPLMRRVPVAPRGAPRLALGAAALAALTFAGCGGSGGGPSTPVPTSTGRPTGTPAPTLPAGTPTPAPNVGAPFVFQSDRDGDNELLEARSDGTVRRLTDNAVADTDPAVAPDGRIAFVSTRLGGAEIFVLGPSGTTRVTNNSFQELLPTWSPDGRRIAFRSTRGGNSDIYIVDADGRNEKRLTHAASRESDPSFGPDGRIYYTSNVMEDGFAQVFSMEADGSQVRQVTSSEADASKPALSPDGRRLVYAADDEEDTDLYTLTLSQGWPQGQAVRIVQPGSLETDPSFARDGRSILFASNRAGNFDIYRANVDGTGARPVAQSPALDRAPRAR